MTQYGAFSPEVLSDGLSEEQLEAIQTEFGEAAAQVADRENRYPAMTYAQGVQAALAWVLGESEDAPLTEHNFAADLIEDQAETYRRTKKPSRRPMATTDPEKL